MAKANGGNPAQEFGAPLRPCRTALLAVLALVSLPLTALAHNGVIPPSLKTIKVPPVPGLLDGSKPIVVDKDKAIALGKALFWDMNVGSDGMACASCHFHAGADSRTQNQFTPGKTHQPKNFSDANGYDPKDPRGANLANWQLTKRDFPLYKFNPDSKKLLEESFTHNAVASAGTFSGQFVGVAKTTTASTGSAQDQCQPYSGAGAGLDQTFHVGSIHTRRVEPRNTPTMINAVLFDRLFWDGRANNIFNGVTPFGPRDKDAYVWIADGGAVWKTRMVLINASAASQAVGPPLNEFEMSCQGRTWPDVGRKLLTRRPLEAQQVAADDSVLGVYRHASGKGLNQTYEDLVKAAFHPQFWSAGVHPMFGKPGYDKTHGFSQAEVNFSLFFGLAIQMYESTLISDDTPFDRANLVLQNGDFVDTNNVLTARQLKGFQDFNDAHCIFCHTGPLFSLATNRITYPTSGGTDYRTMVNRIGTKDGIGRIVDTGYLNNGAAPSEADPGIDNTDDFGYPLAFAPQYLAKLANRPKGQFEPLPVVLACDIGFDNSGYFTAAEFGGSVIPDPAGTVGCVNTNPAQAVVPTADIVAAALDRGAAERQLGPIGHQFKVPQMYNIELTGPYMHNGGLSNLDQVLDQYLTQEGNFKPGNSAAHSNPDMHAGLIFSAPVTREAMLDFLSALTDDRVKYERAPFDHPELRVPNGHPGSEQQTQEDPAHPGLARDNLLVVPAVGKNGRAEPLEYFHDMLPD
jgi:cytochrome c peroxidase